MHDKRSDFNLPIPQNIQNDFNQSSESEEDDDNDNDDNEEENIPENLKLFDTPVIITEDYSESGHEDNEKETVFMFDYFSLPTEVKLLIDQYEHKGKVERKNMIVKYEDGDEDGDDDDEEDEDEIIKTEEGMNNESSSSKQENKSDEDDDDNNKQIEENVVDYRDLIIGNTFDEIGNSQRDTRNIGKENKIHECNIYIFN